MSLQSPASLVKRLKKEEGEESGSGALTELASIGLSAKQPRPQKTRQALMPSVEPQISTFRGETLASHDSMDKAFMSRAF